MCTIDIRVSHDDDFFVSQVINGESGTRLGAQCLAQVIDLAVCRHLAFGCTDNIQDLSP